MQDVQALEYDLVLIMLFLAVSACSWEGRCCALLLLHLFPAAVCVCMEQRREGLPRTHK